MNDSTTPALHRFTVRITLIAPILTQASGSLGFGLDSAMRRDPSDRPALPGTLVRGNLRHAWQQLNQVLEASGANLIDIAGLLGQESSEDNQPDATRLLFDEYWSDRDWHNDTTAHRRYRVSIDERTGAAAQGALQVIESPYPSGQKVTFTGDIQAIMSPQEVTATASLIEKGLRLVPALGGLKGQGFGRLSEVSITSEAVQTQPAPLDKTQGDNSRVGLRITPHAPFCFARPGVGGNNHFESEDFIPGGALIAAIAHWRDLSPGRWPALEEHLDRFACSHARPAAANAKQRPIAIPLSLAHLGKQRLRDIATSEEPPERLSPQALEFQIDWKGELWAKAMVHCNHTASQPDRHLVIRTAIGDEGQAEEGKLFSMESIGPKGFQWLANLDLSGIESTQARTQCLEELNQLFANPLTHLGKTKIAADVRIDAAFPYTQRQGEIEPSTPLILYLQSPARLLPSGFSTPGVNRGEQLFEAYGAAWNQLSGGQLKLERFYARQQLLGGDHWRHRYGTGGKGYHPELFTAPGSVFIFTSSDPAQARTLIEQWQQQGLPQLDDAPGGSDWRRNPWIAANGYGEIAVNLHIDTQQGGTTA
jgi:hypothetical protein